MILFDSFPIPMLSATSLRSLRSSPFRLLPSSILLSLGLRDQPLGFRRMMTQKPDPPLSSKRCVSDNPKVNEFQQVLHSESSTDGWDKCWEKGQTPWDLGGPTPVLVHLHNIGSIPTGTVLIPGCGSGHDVAAIACAQRRVIGLEISDNAIKKATELHSRSPQAEHFSFVKADFFTWNSAQYDLIFDYTFFCAIEPELRSLWASKVCDLLKPDGELITLIFPIDDHEGGPPYKVSVANYEEVLHPLGFKATLIADNKLAVAPRMGREKLGRWRQAMGRSSM